MTILFEVINDISNINITIEDIEIEVPNNKEHGDFSSNVAMKLSKRLNMRPYEFGNVIKEKVIKRYDIFEDIKIEGPGFINFYIKKDYFIREIFNSIEKGDFKRFNHKNKNVKLSLVLNDTNKILELSDFRAFMNMYYLGNIYNLAGYKVLKSIVVNENVNLDISYFLSNFKGIEVTNNLEKLKDSIVFCSVRNQFLFKSGKERTRYVVDKVRLFNNKIEKDDIDIVGLIDILGFDRLKYSLCTQSFSNEVDIEITRDDLRFISYPYMRISFVINILEKEGISLNDIEKVKEIILDDGLEKDILTKLTEFKDAVESSITYNDPYKFIKYVNDLCDSFYKLNSTTLFRKLSKEKLLSRLKLLNSVKIVLREALKVLEIPINYCS